MTLGDVLDVRRGISTGKNEFFVLTDADVRKHRIPKRYLRRVLPTRIKLPERAFADADWELLAMTGHRCWLLVLPPEKLELFESPVRDYLREGLRRGLHTTPTAARLKVWYSLPVASEPPDIFCTYLFRGAPRFLDNQAKVLHLTNILGAKLTADFSGAHRIAIVETLNRQAERWAEAGLFAREYRDGLRKVEPRELASLPLEVLPAGSAVAPSRHREETLSLFSR